MKAASIAALALITCTAAGVAAQPAHDPCPCSPAKPGFVRRDALTGDWGGRRTWLEDHGVELGASYTSEVFAAPVLERPAVFAGLGALSLDLALDELVAPALGAVHVVGFAIHGDSLSAEIMDVWGVSNNVATNEVRLFELWVDQPIGNGGVRAGLLSADQEFVIASHSPVLMNSTFGMIGQLSLNLGGPVYPVATPGVRACEGITSSESIARPGEERRLGLYGSNPTCGLAGSEASAVASSSGPRPCAPRSMTASSATRTACPPTSARACSRSARSSWRRR